MGQTLRRAAQWTSAQDGQKGKLEFTALNEEFINMILQFVEEGKSVEESHLIFKKPLSWKTTLTAEQLSGPGYSTQDDSLQSTAVSPKDKMPLLELKDGVLSILSLTQAIYVLQVAHERKLTELRACLEENRDPVANMLGDRFATVEGSDNSIYRFHEEITKEIEALIKNAGDNDEEKAKELEEKKSILSLRLKLQRLDEQMMNASIIKITQDVRLNPKIVDGEVTVLKRVCGPDKTKFALEDIDYYGDGYIYQNGCRAAPWRQLNGDICYLVIHCFDNESGLYVTANTSGYYLNKGPSADKTSQLDFDRPDQDTYRELVSLLKVKSPHFAEMITQQEFTMRAHKEKDSGMVMVHDGENDEGDRTQRSDKNNKQHKDQQQDKDKTQKTQNKKKLQPSLKWRNLMVEEEEKKT